MRHLHFAILFLVIALNITAKEKEGYNPWYTGPIVTPSASNQPPGTANIQPYFYLQDNYGKYETNRKHEAIPDTMIYQCYTTLQPGITNWLDLTLGYGVSYKTKKSKDATTLSDLEVKLGFQILREEKNTAKPNIRFTLNEIFPTGKYNNLNPSKLGLDSGGAGSFDTHLCLIFSKIFYWLIEHPIDMRLALQQNLPAKVSVKNFNTYGGGYGTKGKVTPAKYFTLYYAFQFSFTQQWAFATDFVYTTSNKTTFSGDPGLTTTGAVASNGSKKTSLISLAPCIEYSFNQDVGILGGVWFSVWGKNTAEFLIGTISLVANF